MAADYRTDARYQAGTGRSLLLDTFWQGHRMDPTGLYWLGARYYDPCNRRFLSPDPLGHGSDPTLYTYADFDPVNNMDPTGRCSYVAQGFMSVMSRATSASSITNLQLTDHEAYSVLSVYGKKVYSADSVIDLKNNQSSWESAKWRDLTRQYPNLGENDLAQMEASRLNRRDAKMEIARQSPTWQRGYNTYLLALDVIVGIPAEAAELYGLTKFVTFSVARGVIGNRIGTNFGPGGRGELSYSPSVGAPGGSPKLFVNQFPSHEIVPPTQTFNPSQVGSPNFSRTLNYAVNREGNLVMGRIGDEPGGGHIDLVGGRPVQAAGEVHIVNGQIRQIDNTSGHYLPSGSSAEKAAVNAFNRAGLNANGTYVEKIWNGNVWVPKE
jgi:RHS repeat-associated protein